MSATKWTGPQQAAIEDRGGTLLVSAAAGSGKTAVLVERAVRMICDEEHSVSADRLLIVTFTRAAAEELRGRIASRLAQEAAAHPGSAFLRRQRLLLGRADICTIDAFCMQLLKTYFAPLNLPPDFTLADDAQAFALRNQALAETLEEAYQDPDFRAFAGLYGRARSDAAAAGAVEAMYDFARTLPGAQEVLHRLCADYDSDAPLGETPWGRFLLDGAGEAAAGAAALLRAAQALVAQEEALTNYAPALAEDLAFFEALQEDIAAGRWDDAARRAALYAPPPFKAVRGYDGLAMDTVKALRTEAKTVLADLQKNVFICSEAEFAADRAQTAPLLRALARAAEAFGERFFARKLEEKALEYSDFEHLSLQLLWDGAAKTATAQAVSARYDAVMVDEYQDTNALQALLYHCLANEDVSNLFFVGDVKQSIYRFRLASPEIFIEKREAFAPYRAGDAHPATITLGHNFRSAANVIDQINDVFACVMSKAVGDVDYNEDERLYPGASNGYDGGPMELLIADTQGQSTDGADAALVAQTVRRLVDEGFLVREKNGGTRPCEYGDVCVLLRSRARFALYEAALAAVGIPAAADAGGSALTAPETAPLLSLLRVIDNPAQDVYVAAVLLSPLFGFTPDDLTRLRVQFPRMGLYAALTHSTGEKEQAFCARLQALRRLAATAPIGELCDAIFASTHYFAAVGAMENGPERRENLRAFVAWASGVGAGGLSSLLRIVDNALDSGAPMGAAPPMLPRGAVSIMTVHRSKGLEFPVVILADCARRFNLRDTASPVLFHPVLGAGLALRAGEGGGLYATAPHRAIRMAQRAEAVSEEMRILYVALTRARDKLVVTLPLQNPEKTLGNLATNLAGMGTADPYLLGQASCLADWLCAFGLLHPGGEALRKAAGGATLPLLPAKGELRAAVVLAQCVEQAAAQPEFVRTAAPDAALLQQLQANFAAVYPRAPLCALPIKVSVSALAHKGDAPVLARPAFLYKEGLTAAERGTALHSVLQFADFAAAQSDLHAEVRRLAEEGYIDKALAERLNMGHMKTFLASPLAGRIQAAQTVLREYDFLTAVPARFVQPEIDPAFAHRPVEVQGIADVVLVNGDTAELVDYKTDRGKTPAQLLQAYSRQLALYRAAVEKQLGLRVTRCTLYAFALGREIDVPLCAVELAEV